MTVNEILEKAIAESNAAGGMLGDCAVHSAGFVIQSEVTGEYGSGIVNHYVPFHIRIQISTNCHHQIQIPVMNCMFPQNGTSYKSLKNV
jgi:hypothetical protein